LDASEYDVTKEDIIGSDIKQIELLADGALIFALEDEYAQVRLEAVRTLAKMSWCKPNFCALAIPHMMHMFHDDDYTVRLTAMKLVADLAAVMDIAMDLEQVQSVISCMERQTDMELPSFLSRAKRADYSEDRGLRAQICYYGRELLA
jgi:hypothetical protein